MKLINYIYYDSVLENNIKARRRCKLKKMLLVK